MQKQRYISPSLHTRIHLTQYHLYRKEKKRTHFNAADTTTFLLNISYVGYVVWALSYVLCGTLIDTKFYTYKHVRPLAVTVAAPSLIMALLNVSMMWIEVAEVHI